MRVAKGINVRPKGGKFYVFLNHKGQRLAFQYNTEDEAKAMAEGFAALQKSGRLDEVFKPGAPEKEATTEPTVKSAPMLPALKDYYSRRFEKRLRLRVRPSTLGIYENAFQNHLFPALLPLNPDVEDSPLKPLGEFRLNELKRPHMTALVEFLMNKTMSRVVNQVEEKADGTAVKTRKVIEFKLSRPSLRIILSALTTCLANAHREDELIPSNPALAPGFLPICSWF